MSEYTDRINSFNRAVEDTREHAENIANQIANVKAIAADKTRSMFDKVNDSVGSVSGAISTGAQIIHTYKHGKVLTFLERHDINQALGRNGNSGTKNAGNELLDTIDQARNAPTAGLSPDSAGIQLPEATPADLVSSLKGRLIGNEEEGAQPNDLAVAAKSKGAIKEANEASNNEEAADLINQQPSVAETSFTSAGARRVEGDSAPESAVQGAEPEAEQATGTAVKLFSKPGLENAKTYTAEGLDPARAGGSDMSPADRLDFAKQFTESDNSGSNFLRPVQGAVEDVEGAADAGSDLVGAVSNAGSVANIAKSVAGTLAKGSGEAVEGGLADSVAAGLEAAAPETGPIAPLVAAVGGLVALGSSLAGLFHKHKTTTAPPPPPPVQAQIGADLSVSK